MPTVTTDARSFLLDGRRTTIVGAGMEYAGVDPSVRPVALKSLRSLGFNTVLSSCPWLLHERTPGSLDFEERLDVGAFLEDAWSANLQVILRIGPVVGSPFDGGGLPAWIGDRPDVESRSGEAGFLELVSSWFGRIAAEVREFQADRDGGGPLLAIQLEHDWRCGSHDAGESYLRELVRFARESGLSVPILTANGFWAPVEGAAETWFGWDDLFTNVRQMSVIQPSMPRLCVIDRSSQPEAFHRPGRGSGAVEGRDIVDRMARVLAAGGQPVVAHAVDAVFPAGACGRDEHGEISPAPFTSPLVDATGATTSRGREVARFARFVRDFGSLVAELDPDDRPIVRDPDHAADHSVVVPRRGGTGDLVLGLGSPADPEVTLVDEDGRRMTFDFSDRPTDWRLFDADLDGHGRLEFASATPLALVGGRLLLLAAPSKSTVEISIDGRLLELTAPDAASKSAATRRPTIAAAGRFTIVLLDQRRTGDILGDDEAIFLDVASLEADGSVVAAGEESPLRIDLDGGVSKPTVRDRMAARTRRNRGWSAWSEPDPWDPEHPRSIPMDGPLGLSAIGAGLDHAWFTAPIDVPDSKSRSIRLLGGLQDGGIWLDGEGAGRLDSGGFSLKTTKGSHDFAVFAVHQPRLVDGVRAPGDGDRPGALVAVKPLAGVKRRQVDLEPIDPFSVASFVPGAADGELTSHQGVELSFTHRRRSRVLLEIAPGSGGVVVLNDEPHAVFGPTGTRLVLCSRSIDGFKAGANRITILPLEHVVDEGRTTEVAVLEVVEELVPENGWRVRRFETSPDPRIGIWNGAPTRAARAPRWVRTTIPIPRDAVASGAAASVRLEGLIRGRVRVNGVELGGYALRVPGERTARNVTAPELAIPDSILADHDEIELEIFDEAGADPSKVVVRI